MRCWNGEPPDLELGIAFGINLYAAERIAKAKSNLNGLFWNV